MIAFCGLVCSECPAFRATHTDDSHLRTATAALWSTQFGTNIAPEDINCRGCRNTDDELLDYCRICEIRRCGLERGVPDCAGCPEYPCSKLVRFFALVPDARRNLDALRTQRNQTDTK